LKNKSEVTKMVIVKNQFKDKKLVKLLAFIIAATEGPATFGFAPEKEVDEIAAAQPTFLTVDKTQKDANGNVKVSSTPAAKAALEAAPAPAAAQPKQALNIALETGIPVPEAKRGPTRVEVYPFSKMDVGASFFVASTTERPDPAKALSSTVGSATKRYNEPVVENGVAVMENAKRRDGSEFQRPKMKQTRKFIIRAVEGGARIWRTA
jgi:hypothetical protein